MRLILIRHAEAIANLQGINAVKDACRGLTKQGIQQAEHLVERLRASGELSDCQVFLTSPVPRARQTAAILASALPVKTCIEEVSLSEVNPGEAEGMTDQEILEKYGDFYQGGKPPGGENLADFVSRVQTLLGRLPDQYPDKTVVAITHAGFLIATVAILFSLHDHDWAPTGITEIHWQDGQWQLVRQNDWTHLHGAPKENISQD
jgi:broad specificity phosphatase PhoE